MGPNSPIRKGKLLALRLAVGCLMAAAASMAAAWPAPARLKPKTQDAFELYIRLTTARHDEELRRNAPSLWVDTLPEARRQQVYAQLQQGEVKIERLETRQDGKPMECPGGMIHHWVGVIFIPGATLERTLRLVQDYDNHATYYKPDVMRSKMLERRGNDFKVYLRFLRKKVITVVLNTEHEIHYFPVDATRAHSRSRTTRIAQVEDQDTPKERENPVGDDGGYLWRMDTWWRFVERDGGTYVQCEAVSLTRDIPPGLGWLIGPFVTGIPRESLMFTLTATRAALARKAAVAGGP